MSSHIGWQIEKQRIKEEVGGLIPDCEISSLLDRKLVRWSIASCALALACRHSVSKKEEKRRRYLHCWKIEVRKIANCLVILFFKSKLLRLCEAKNQPERITNV